MLEIFEIIRSSLDGSSPFWLFVFFFFGTFVSEDAACLLAGTAVANGTTSLELAIFSCLLGIFAGDMLLYGIGRFVGTPIFDNKFVQRFIAPVQIEKAGSWLGKNAASAIFVSRFVSGMRLPTYILAGVVRADVKRFAFFFLIAAAIWTPLLVGSVAFAQRIVFPNSLFIGFVSIAVATRLIFKFASWKNRRLFVGRIRRLANWEFWPLGVFYAPVVVYVSWLCIRSKGLIFTASNPSMPASGFVGESKYDIYALIEKAPSSSQHLLAYCKLTAQLPSEDRIARARSFIRNEQLEFPIILKPDVGERGKGVRIVPDEDELRQQLDLLTEAFVIQEFAPGVEVSVFYFRFPTEPHGQIFSITQKEFPAVVGDGRSDIETLILRDPRAVSLAGQYSETNRDRLAAIPAEGEVIQLVDIGTHSRGAIFSDGGHLRTPELERAIDELSRGIDGFYFGRFDLRSPSIDKLMRGNFKIVELNGVTSESTNIYDPGYSLLDAYRILFAQWKIAFAIGAANHRLGAKCLSLREFIKLIRNRDVSQIETLKPMLSQKESCA